ncbi:MAG: hypothetical protein QW279_09175, partial [Candidatus Jordarchaeaceae archaeon]
RNKPYISRTKQKYKVPFHAPYAYPFLKSFLRGVLGDYRLLDIIALATARHHSLEVTGKIKANMFQLADSNVINFLHSLTLQTFPELEDTGDLSCLFNRSVQTVNEGSLIDEPPGPSDDFYFLYAISNRIVKLADWEDAGNKKIELSSS